MLQWSIKINPSKTSYYQASIKPGWPRNQQNTTIKSQDRLKNICLN